MTTKRLVPSNVLSSFVHNNPKVEIPMAGINLLSLRLEPTFLAPLCDSGAGPCEPFSSACRHNVRLCQSEGPGGTWQDGISRKALPFWVLALLPYFYPAQVLTPGSTHLCSPHRPVPTSLVLPTLRPPSCLNYPEAAGHLWASSSLCPLCPFCITDKHVFIPVVATFSSKTSEPKPVRGRARSPKSSVPSELTLPQPTCYFQPLIYPFISLTAFY